MRQTTTLCTTIVFAFLLLAGALAVPAAAEPTDGLILLDGETDSVVSVSTTGAVTTMFSKADIKAATGASRVGFKDSGLALDKKGNVYFTESYSDSVLKFDAALGTLSVVASEADLIAAAGGKGAPGSLAYGGQGVVYVADASSDSVLAVDTKTGAVSVVASKADFTALPGVSSADLDGGITATAGGTIYVTSSKGPDAIFRIKGGEVSLVTDHAGFGDLDGFMAVDPSTGDLIVVDDDDGDGVYNIYRVGKDGSVSVFLSQDDLAAVTGGTVDLNGGVAFDDTGNLYLAETSTSSIYVFDAAGNGSVFMSGADFAGLTGSMPSLRGAIAWSSVPNPEPGTLLLVALGVALLVWRRRRRRHARSAA